MKRKTAVKAHINIIVDKLQEFIIRVECRSIEIDNREKRGVLDWHFHREPGALIFLRLNQYRAPVSFHHQRNNLARKLSNERLRQNTFHTLRQLARNQSLPRNTRHILIQRRLGHRSITNTMKYIHLAETYFGEEEDEYIIKVAENIEQAVPLIEAVDYNGVKVFKKRKSGLRRVR